MDAVLSTILDRWPFFDVKRMPDSSSDTLLASTLRDLAGAIRRRARLGAVREKKADSDAALRLAERRIDERKERLGKLSADFRVETKFVNRVIIRNCALIIQRQRNHQKLVAKERAAIEFEMTAKRKHLRRKRDQIYEIQIRDSIAELENIRVRDVRDEEKRRNSWNIEKAELKYLIMKYDAKMFTQQEELENIRITLNREADQLCYFKRAYTVQEKSYNELMKEKEVYEEQQRRQQLHEIRRKIATRTIVKFVENHYPAWKKKKLKRSKRKMNYKLNVNRKK